MIPLSDLLLFAGAALVMVLTPGPNMIYLISRSICQGRVAGLISLGGVALGFVFYMLCAAFGLTALVYAPFGYIQLPSTLPSPSVIFAVAVLGGGAFIAASISMYRGRGMEGTTPMFRTSTLYLAALFFAMVADTLILG